MITYIFIMLVGNTITNISQQLVKLLIPRGASTEHLLNRQACPAKRVGAVCALASEASSTNRDKRRCPVEAVVRCS